MRFPGSGNRTDRPRWEWPAVALLTVAAFGLRLTGIDFLLPHLTEPDLVYALQPQMIRGEFWHPLYASYPLLVGDVLLVLPRADEPGPSAPLEARLAHAKSPLLRPRWILAALAALAVPATWWVMRAFAGPPWAAFAAALTATSLMHVNFSQQGRPHAAVTALIAVALCCALRVQRFGRWSDWLAGWLACALAFAVLHSGLAAVPALAAAAWLRPRAPRRARLFWYALPLALLVLVVVVFYPYLLPGEIGHWSRASPDKLQLGSHYVRYSKFDGSGFGTLLLGTWRHDPVLLALAGLGLVCGAAQLARADPRLPEVRASLRQVVVIAAFAVPYALVFGSFGGTLARFATPLIPVLACLASYAVLSAARALAPSGWWRLCVPAACAAALALPTYAAGRLAWLRRRPDTLELAATWIAANARPGERLWVQPGTELPVDYTAEALRFDREHARDPIRCFWTRDQLARGPCARPGAPIYVLPDYGTEFWSGLARDPAATLAPLGRCRVACLRDLEDRYGGETDLLRRALMSAGKLVFELPAIPDAGGGRASFLHHGEEFLRECLRAARVGPVVEIYALDPLAR